MLLKSKGTGSCVISFDIKEEIILAGVGEVIRSVSGADFRFKCNCSLSILDARYRVNFAKLNISGRAVSVYA